MSGRAALIAGLAALVCGAAPAQDLAVPLPPTARAVIDEVSRGDSLRLPVTPWRAGEVQTIVAEGDIRRRVWQIGSPGMTTQQIMAPIRAALEKAGFQLLLDCKAQACGGFSFRFATDTLPPPEMFVDLGDYRFVAAQRDGPAGTVWVATMVSRSDATGFVQATEVFPGVAPDAGPESGPDLGPESDLAAPPLRGGTDVVRALIAEGRAVLSDLSFPPGSAELGPGPFEALADLAAYLGTDPALRIMLVGHTDAEGALPGNIELSRRRAASVRDRLIERYGLAPERLRAEGVGYLSPLVPNTTVEGREVNRRVEVILDEGP